eukprot:2615398-Prymnesium_polylepis.1
MWRTCTSARRSKVHQLCAKGKRISCTRVARVLGCVPHHPRFLCGVMLRVRWFRCSQESSHHPAKHLPQPRSCEQTMLPVHTLPPPSKRCPGVG